MQRDDPQLLRAYLNEHPTHARGIALIMFLTLLLIGAMVVLVKQLNQASAQNSRRRLTEAALVQVKEALLGYAATYRDDHKDDVFGYLPLPDLGTSRNNNPPSHNIEGFAASNFLGNKKNLTAIGRVPWRTLGLPPLRDEYGECLWYAVSGSYQNVQQTDMLNWDTVGIFDIYGSDGTPGGTNSLIGVNLHQQPAAVIFSAGPPLPGQDRSTSTADDVTECGGNYDVHNYLDPQQPTVSINNIINSFPGSTNNATDPSVPVSTTKALIGSPTQPAGGQALTNDRMLAVAPADIFSTVKKRSDFQSAINTLIGDVANCLSTLPPPDKILMPGATGAKQVGTIQTIVESCPSSLGGTDKTAKNWKDQFLYAVCSGSPCLSVTSGTNTHNCTGALIFAGERTASQSRATSVDRASLANYLEGLNLVAFTSFATTLLGSPSFSIPTGSAPASQDVVVCLP